MQFKLFVLPLLALAFVAAAHHLRLAGYEDGYTDSLDVEHQFGVDPMIYDTECAKLSANFCPTYKFPRKPRRGPFAIVPTKAGYKCLDVRGGVFRDYNPVQIWDCNGSVGQKWVIDRRYNQIRVAGTNFCLNTGACSPAGTGLLIHTCIQTFPGHMWVYKDNRRISTRWTNMCVDLPNGSVVNGQQVQIKVCDVNSINQIWHFRRV
ncbi:hypothetical protein D9619_004904 [Psilocybe cf. subviscida]|uniref:Ricin B lectin domain-containing protein n=1 Tax=Psilocybe cf. subviscida TaxID=2480587 RepID=A0A8H5BQU7_9AGAR|nr:hypothetical protein D9619_004904 [Psilocybe cf. subviscida]